MTLRNDPIQLTQDTTSNHNLHEESDSTITVAPSSKKRKTPDNTFSKSQYARLMERLNLQAGILNNQSVQLSVHTTYLNSITQQLEQLRSMQTKILENAIPAFKLLSAFLTNNQTTTSQPTQPTHSVMQPQRPALQPSLTNEQLQQYISLMALLQHTQNLQTSIASIANTAPVTQRNAPTNYLFYPNVNLQTTAHNDSTSLANHRSNPPNIFTL